jgi:hypothetical protein
MISPSLINTEVAVEEGEATLEITEIHKQNDIRIDADGVTVQLVKQGFYDFDAARNQLIVLDGEAISDDHGEQVKIKGGHELTLSQESTRPQSFNTPPNARLQLIETVTSEVIVSGVAKSSVFRI